MPIDVHAHYVPQSAHRDAGGSRPRLRRLAGQDAAAMRAAFRLWTENPPVLSQADRAGRAAARRHGGAGRHLPGALGLARHFRLWIARRDCRALAPAPEREPVRAVLQASGRIRLVRLGAAAGRGGSRARSRICHEAIGRRRTRGRRQRRGHQSGRVRARRVLGHGGQARRASIHPSRRRPCRRRGSPNSRSCKSRNTPSTPRFASAP